MDRIIFIESITLITSSSTAVIDLHTDINNEEEFMRDVFVKWGTPYDFANWNAFFDDLCDLSWMDDITTVAMVHTGQLSLNRAVVNEYFQVLIHALFRHEVYPLVGRARLNDPALVALFRKEDWDWYLFGADTRTLERVKYLLADSNSRNFDRSLF